MASRLERAWMKKFGTPTYGCRGFQNAALNRIVREFVPEMERVGLRMVPSWAAGKMRAIRRS